MGKTVIGAEHLVRLHTDKMYRAGITWYEALVPVSDEGLLNLSLDQNIRKEMEGTTSINKDVSETLEESPELFHLLNGGIVVTAREIRCEGQAITVTDGSVLDGAQTRKVLKRLLDQEESPNALVRVEFIKAPEEVAERMTFTRNTRHPVSLEAFSNRLGAFDFLLAAMPDNGPDWQFDVDGTKSSAWSVVQLAKVVIMATRQAVLDAVGCPKKWTLYSGGKRKLLDALYWANSAGGTISDYLGAANIQPTASARAEHAEEFEAYRKFREALIANAVNAWEAYLRLRGDNPFAGTGVRVGKFYRRRRTDQGVQDVLEIPDAMVFPLLHGLSYVGFDQTQGGAKYWPKVVKSVIDAYQGAGWDITSTGKSSSAYTTIDTAAELLDLV